MHNSEKSIAVLLVVEGCIAACLRTIEGRWFFVLTESFRLNRKSSFISQGGQAVVVLGGLITTTLFNLFVLPALYLHYGASREAELDFQPTAGVDFPVAADD